MKPPIKPSKTSGNSNFSDQTVLFWAIVGLGLVVVFLGSYMYFSPDPQPIQPQNASSMNHMDIEKVLRPHQRLFIYDALSGVNECRPLKPEHANYHDIVATNERFVNTQCGDIRVFIDEHSVPPRTTIVANNIKDCECQREYIKRKPKINPKQKVFTDEDLH
jgi:hypothetical protein